MPADLVRSRLALLLLLVVTAGLLSSAAPLIAQDASGHWEGKIDLGPQSLDVMVDLTNDSGSWSGTIDIPAQGAKGLPLGGFVVDGDKVQFAIEGIPGNPTFAGSLTEDEITGDFSQGGQSFPFALGRDAIEPPKRPQEPKPPFPYDQEEVSYSSGDVTLAGTLTLPRGDGLAPAALLITGSGAQNRDEELMGHKPFMVLADHLTRAGIAVLRVDDRGVGGSTGNVATSTSDDFAGDALAGVGFLRNHPKIDSARIGLIGHSEGGLVGPLAASRSGDVAFVVMLAGPGVSGAEILSLQLELISRAAGVPPETIAEQKKIQAQMLEALVAPESEERTQHLRELIAAQVEAQGSEMSAEERSQTIDSALKQVDNNWFRFFVAYDPRPTLRAVNVPVLAINGELDLQVDAEQNLPEIEKSLQYGNNQDFTILRMPRLNHLFQTATTGAVDEYAQIEETLSPEVLEAVSGWILERFGE